MANDKVLSIRADDDTIERLNAIAEQSGISRQGVWDNIRRADAALEELEEKTVSVKFGATYQPGEAECYLGRPWHPSSAKGAVSCAAVFRECQIDDVLAEDGWSPMANKSGEADPAKERMFEYKNTGDGAKINKSRRQLSDADAANYTVAKYLDGWTPEEVSYK